MVPLSRLEVPLKKKLACTATLHFNRSVTPTRNFVAVTRVRMRVRPDGAGKSVGMTLTTVKTKKILTKYGWRKTLVIGSNTAQTTLIM
jgi:hypothetical protein